MPGKEDKVDVVLVIEGGILTTSSTCSNKVEHFSYKGEQMNV